MAKAGRPPGITPEITKTICDAIKEGAYIETAVVVAGVPKATFYGWLAFAERDRKKGLQKSPYMQFAAEVVNALATAELELLRNLQKGGVQWQRYAWMLERRFRERWAISKGDPGQKAA